MELWQSILVRILQEGSMEVFFSKIDNLAALFESECYKTLLRIKRILENDAYTDKECFEKIDDSITEFDAFGGLDSSRHDFG